jgi:hypothetical protein
MGEVWEAIDLRLRRSVAVKLLPLHPDADHASAVRFRREAEISARVGHPSITILYDIDEHQGPCRPRHSPAGSGVRAATEISGWAAENSGWAGWASPGSGDGAAERAPCVPRFGALGLVVGVPARR